MFKIIKILLLSIILVVLSLGFYVWVQKKTLISDFLSKKLNMEVELEDVSVSWGKLSLKQLRLKNHTGSSIPDAFLGDIIINMNPTNLINETIRIDHVELNQPIFYLELYNFTGSDNNWSRLMNSFPPSNDRTFVIEKLTICDLQFHPIKQSHSKKLINLPKMERLEFEHLGSKSPLTISQVTKAVFESILFSLTSKPGLGDILKSVKSLPRQVLEGTSSTIPMDASDKLQESLHFLKRKTLETKEAIENWVNKKD